MKTEEKLPPAPPEVPPHKLTHIRVGQVWNDDALDLDRTITRVALDVNTGEVLVAWIPRWNPTGPEVLQPAGAFLEKHTYIGGSQDDAADYLAHGRP